MGGAGQENLGEGGLFYRLRHLYLLSSAPVFLKPPAFFGSWRKLVSF